MKPKKRRGNRFHERHVLPLTRMVPGDLVRILRVDWMGPADDGVRMWDSDAKKFVYIPVGDTALLIKVIRPVTEFNAKSRDAHWIAILHRERHIEALSDEVEAMSP